MHFINSNYIISNPNRRGGRPDRPPRYPHRRQRSWRTVPGQGGTGHRHSAHGRELQLQRAARRCRRNRRSCHDPCGQRLRRLRSVHRLGRHRTVVDHVLAFHGLRSNLGHRPKPQYGVAPRSEPTDRSQSEQRAHLRLVAAFQVGHAGRLDVRRQIDRRWRHVRQARPRGRPPPVRSANHADVVPHERLPDDGD